MTVVTTHQHDLDQEELTDEPAGIWGQIAIRVYHLGLKEF
jgi:hypothetical protein